MALQIKKARKEKIWVKVAVGGSSGSGKTYSALRLATGIAKAGGYTPVDLGDGEKAMIGFIDTEAGRCRYYANEFNFADLQLSDDDPKVRDKFTPERYIEAIDLFEDMGFKVLVIDSLSHEWQFLNDLNNKMGGNTWANWSKLTPRHDKLMEKILQSPMHIIATMRGKDKYETSERDGKKVIKKVAEGLKQRDNIEYDYTTTFMVDQETHVATVTKDNTHLFENRYEVLTEKDGEALFNWANSGEGVMPVMKSLSKIINDIKIEFGVAMNKGIDKEVLYKIVENCGAPKNFLQIDNVDLAEKVLNEIKGARK